METIQATQSEPGNADSDREYDIHMKEWEIARGVLEFFDDKLHDLRKYGFSFVTALLTAEGVLETSEGASASAGIKFAVFFVTLILILALHLIDRNYVVFQRAATTRALVLERKLNIELSDIITDRYRIEQVNGCVAAVYILFTFGVLVLGYYSLGMHYVYSVILWVIAIWATILTLQLNVSYRWSSPKKGRLESALNQVLKGLRKLLRITGRDERKEDWTISPLECSKKHGTVKITLTNLAEPDEDSAIELLGDHGKGKIVPKPIRFSKDQLLWKITNEESGKVSVSRTANEDIRVYDSRTWILKGEDFGEPGVYQLWPSDWPVPLYRRIIIIGEESSSQIIISDD